jgi:probable HAF family extracellular repeat protein
MPAVVLALVGTSFAGATGGARAATLPLYSVDVVVPNGIATALNEAGDIVGWQYSNYSPRAFAYTSGQLSLLPTPADRPLSVARDVNDAGAIVGYAYKTTIDEPGNAMRWTLGPSGWTVQDLGFLPGDLVSEATGVNDAGKIVGRSNPRSFLNEHGFLYTDSQGMTALLPGYTFVPQDINELGVAVGNGYSTAQRVDTETGAGQNLEALFPYYYSNAYAINDAGQIAGALTSGSGSSQVVARYSDATGWQVLGGIGGGSCSGCVHSVQNIGWGINSAGTVVGTGWPRTGATAPYQRAVIFLDSVGSLLYVDDLLDAGSGWSISSAYDINDAGQIAGYARNSLTGQTAAVRLSPIGTLQVPSAPSSLTATPYAAVFSQEQNRIDLRWLDNSVNETAFEVERRQVDQFGAPLSTYTRLVSVSANVTTYSDVALSLGAYYQYRVRALGIAGPSAYSNAPIARAPTTTPETVPPTVRITSPVSLATVSKIVTVKISATDNVAIIRVELLVDTNLIGTCTLATPPTYTCRWDTRKWSNGGWTLYARAWDKAGNLGIDAITVFVKNGRQR